MINQHKAPGLQSLQTPFQELLLDLLASSTSAKPDNLPPAPKTTLALLNIKDKANEKRGKPQTITTGPSNRPKSPTNSMSLKSFQDDFRGIDVVFAPVTAQHAEVSFSLPYCCVPWLSMQWCGCRTLGRYKTVGTKKYIP